MNQRLEHQPRANAFHLARARLVQVGEFVRLAESDQEIASD